MLGKTTSSSDLPFNHKLCIREVVPQAQFETGIVYNHLMINGVIHVYTSINYSRPTTSCDDVLTFVTEGVKRIGQVELFASVCKLGCVCSSPCTHVVVATELLPVLNPGSYCKHRNYIGQSRFVINIIINYTSVIIICFVSRGQLCSFLTDNINSKCVVSTIEEVKLVIDLPNCKEVNL